MKKISITIWIILAGIFLYTATLWQRPLFVFEFSDWAALTEPAAKGSLLPLSRHLELFILNKAGASPFFFRIGTALLTLLSALVLFLSGNKSTLSNASKGGAMIFLLTPAIFLGGTSAAPALQQGSLLTAALFALFGASESQNWKSALPWGVAAAAALTGSVTLFTAPLLYLAALGTLLVFLICRGTLVPGQYSVKSYLALLLPFVPGLFFLAQSDLGGSFHLPGKTELKTLAAFIGAGTFPWVVFTPALLRNGRSRLKELLQTPFTLFSLILFICTLGTALFTTGITSLAASAAALAGMAVIWSSLMEMEYLENGSCFLDRILWILAILFFLGAAAVGTYGALTLYTKMLPPALKLFTARDAWALTALVPAVSAIWFVAGAGEKLHKERKFLAFCAGTAFALLAFHGLVPLKVVENNAPVKFLNQAVASRLPRSAEIYCDKELLTPATAVFKGRTIKKSLFPDQFETLKTAVRKKQSICVLTLSRKTSDSLPFPKTTIRSGRFTAVFYNIDFPEMYTRKP